MTMASLTASLLARKGQAQPSASARDIFAPSDEADPRPWQSPVKSKPQQKTQLCPVPSSDTGEKETRQRSPRSAIAPTEARHTRLVQADEVAPTPATKRVKAKTQSRGDTSRKHKSLRLDEQTDLQLRLLAARRATSQQSLMEEALKLFLDHETETSRCICGSKKA